MTLLGTFVKLAAHILRTHKRKEVAVTIKITPTEVTDFYKREKLYKKMLEEIGHTFIDVYAPIGPQPLLNMLRHVFDFTREELEWDPAEYIHLYSVYLIMILQIDPDDLAAQLMDENKELEADTDYQNGADKQLVRAVYLSLGKAASTSVAHSFAPAVQIHGNVQGNITVRNG